MTYPKLTSLWPLILALLLTSAASAERYRWPLSTPAYLVAPSDKQGTLIEGAALQGGLVDLRFGQASVDVHGVGIILDWDPKTTFTLNALPVKAEDLSQLLEKGRPLKVAIRYDPDSGLISWLDAIESVSSPNITLQLQDSRPPTLRPGQALTVTVTESEARRLAMKPKRLFVPGSTHSLTFSKVPLGWQAVLPTLSGWEWNSIPLFVIGTDDRAYRGTTFTMLSPPLSVTEFGPRLASGRLEIIPCWIDLEPGHSNLDAAATKIETSSGGIISDIQIRNGRLSFHLQTIGAGLYPIQAKLVDLSNRVTEMSWTIVVRP